MRIYISGKISGLDIKVAEGLFEQMENLLQQKGFIPVNPMKLVPYDPALTWEDYMVEDIRAIFACQAIVMLDNWHLSRGAKIEHAIAQQIGLEIYYPSMHRHLLD